MHAKDRRLLIGVGAQYEETVVAFFLGDLFLVDGEVAATLDLQEPAIAFIFNESLVAAAQLLATLHRPILWSLLILPESLP